MYSISSFIGQIVELGPVSSDVYVFSTGDYNLSVGQGYYYISRTTQDSEKVFESMLCSLWLL